MDDIRLPQTAALRDFTQHSRSWSDNLYVYPVISRRSKGLSIGVNLNPDTACNFDCIYCQVDRTGQPKARRVELTALERELEVMLSMAQDGSIFDLPEFARTPPHLRRLRDVAFSGDGEPTTCPVFAEAVELTARMLRRFSGAPFGVARWESGASEGGTGFQPVNQGQDAPATSFHKRDGNHAAPTDPRLVLITDACYLTRPEVRRGLEILDANNGEIWAKLDAGTEDYYRLINRPNFPLAHVLENILDAARARPLVIQSLWMNVHGQPPPRAEIIAFAARLRDILDRGGRLKLIQVYTVARAPAEAYVTTLSDAQLQTIAAAVSAIVDVPVETFSG